MFAGRAPGGHGARVDALVSIGQRQPGLFVTGNYLNGVSVAACLAQAVNTAERTHGYLLDLARGTTSFFPAQRIAM